MSSNGRQSTSFKERVKALFGRKGGRLYPFFVALAAIACLGNIGAPSVSTFAGGFLLKLEYPLHGTALVRLKSSLKKDAVKLQGALTACNSPSDRKECDDDGDRLSNGLERWLGTDALLADSDNDGLDDRREILRYHSNPLDASSPNPLGKVTTCANFFFDAYGNTREFEIPDPLKGNIRSGHLYHEQKCVGCHAERGLGLNFTELQEAVKNPPMNQAPVEQADLAHITAYLNRDLAAKNCQNVFSLPVPNSQLLNSSPTVPPGISRASQNKKTNQSQSSRYFDETCTSVPGKFKIPVGLTGSIAAGSKAFRRSCTTGGCHVNGPAAILAGIKQRKMSASFPLIKRMVRGPEMKLKGISDQKFADITAYLNQGRAKKKCQIKPAATPTPTPPRDPLPETCNAQQVFEVVKINCISCHKGASALGNFRVDVRIPWTKASPDLIRALARVQKGEMPPSGAEPLSSAQKELFAACESKNEPSEPILIHKPGDPVTTSSRFTLRRLSKIEYVNALKSIYGNDLLSQAASLIALHPEENSTKRFSSITGPSDYGHIDAYFKVAKALNRTAANNSSFLAQYSCLVSQAASPALTESCLSETIIKMGKIFFRRPIKDTEITRARAAYFLGAQSKNKAEGLASLLNYFAQSPFFLYHIDDTTSASQGEVTLTDAGIANRIALALTKAPPDGELEGLAAQGKLRDSSIRREQALRLLKTSQGTAVNMQFISELVGVHHISPPPADPDFLRGIETTNLIANMQNDVQTFFSRVLARGGSFVNLLNDRDALVDKQLARVYGRDLPDSSPSLIELESGKYGGVLTRAGVVSRGLTSSPYHLAQLIDKNFLTCSPLAPPPNNVLPQDNPLDPHTGPGLTLRQRLERVTSQPNCIGCHRRLNFIFASANYDPIGRWTAQESVVDANGQKSSVPLDTRTKVYYPGDSKGKEVDGPVSLSQLIASNARSAQCFYLKWTSNALGREVDGPDISWILTERPGESQIRFEEMQARFADIISQPAFITVNVDKNREN